MRGWTQADIDQIKARWHHLSDPAPTPIAAKVTTVKRKGPNKTESAYLARLKTRPDLVSIHFEGMTFRMANGHRYTPDFVVYTAAGVVECHEVKGSYALHSQQRARLAFDQAEIEFPWATWVWHQSP